MEIEDKRTQDKRAQVVLEPGHFYEDMKDGEIVYATRDGAEVRLTSVSFPAGREDPGYLYGAEYFAPGESGRFRRLLVKLVILGAMLLALGCTRAQDNGFLTGCDEGSGPIDLEGDCYPIQWDSTPLTVATVVDDGAIGPDDPGEIVQRVIRSWERRRPLQRQDLFIIIDDPRDADVNVVLNSFPEPGSLDVLGDARFWRLPDGRMKAGVRTFNTSSITQLECVIFHELGHVLGLAHDDFGPMREDVCSLECDPGDIECTDDALTLADDALTLVDLRVTDGDHRRLNDVY